MKITIFILAGLGITATGWTFLFLPGSRWSSMLYQNPWPWKPNPHWQRFSERLFGLILSLFGLAFAIFPFSKILKSLFVYAFAKYIFIGTGIFFWIAILTGLVSAFVRLLAPLRKLITAGFEERAGSAAWVRAESITFATLYFSTILTCMLLAAINK